MNTLKLPKGTRDFAGSEQIIREQVLTEITRIFKLYGAVPLDTPVFELRETLMNKYGEEAAESKLVYDLADQGGELLSLRYDLTVPFARYLAMNNLKTMKRYSIGKVYRRDNISRKKKRFREFYQCDFDIAGDYGRMIPDAEVLCVLSRVLTALNLDFVIKLSSRAILDKILLGAGVPQEKVRTICSSIDKLDKMSWETCAREMVAKGITNEQASKIGEYVKLNGSIDEMETILGAESSDLKILFRYLKAMDIDKNIIIDLSLARGLDYYTGIIFEVVLVDAPQVGSVAAGGRYDGLANAIPCVGMSLGVERIMDILIARRAKEKPSSSVFVASIKGDFTAERLQIIAELRRNEITAEISYTENPNFKKQLGYVLENQILIMVIIGETELTAGTAQLKNLRLGTERAVARNELVEAIRVELRGYN